MSALGVDWQAVISKLEIGIPYETTSIDPDLCAIIRNNTATCLLVLRDLSRTHAQSITKLSDEPFSAKGRQVGHGANGHGTKGNGMHNPNKNSEQVYYCNQNVRSFGLLPHPKKPNEKLHILRLSWHGGYILDIAEVGINPRLSEVSFTVENEPGTRRLLANDVRRGLRKSRLYEHEGRINYGNPAYDFDAYNDYRYKVGTEDEVVEAGGEGGRAGHGAYSRRGGGGGATGSSGASGPGRANMANTAANIHENSNLQPLQFPESTTIMVEVYIFQPAEDTTLLGARGVTGKILYQFNLELDIASLQKKSRMELARVHKKSTKTPFIQERVQIKESQEVRWIGHRHLQPSCTLNLESLDPPPKKVKPKKVFGQSIPSEGQEQMGGATGSSFAPNSNVTSSGNTNSFKPLSTGNAASTVGSFFGGSRHTVRKRLVQSLKKVRRSGPTSHFKSRKILQTGVHKAYTLAWTLGRPRSLSYHFYEASSFQKLKFNDLLMLKLRKKNVMQSMEAFVASYKDNAEVNLNCYIEKVERALDDAVSGQGDGTGKKKSVLDGLAQRFASDMKAVEKLKYQFVYNNVDVWEVADGIKKYYYRAGYNNHILNPKWFESLNRNVNWASQEFYIRNAVIDPKATNEKFSDEEGSEVSTSEHFDEIESSDDESIPEVPYLERLKEAKEVARDYVIQLQDWMVPYITDVCAARALVASIESVVATKIVNRENFATEMINTAFNNVVNNRLLNTYEDAHKEKKYDEHGNPMSYMDQLQNASVVDGVLRGVYAGTMRNLKVEGSEIANAVLPHLFSSVLKQAAQMEPNVKAPTFDYWNNIEGNDICSLDSFCHSSIAFSDGLGPYQIGCDGVKKIRHHPRDTQPESDDEEDDVKDDAEKRRKRKERRKALRQVQEARKAAEKERKRKMKVEISRFKKKIRKKLEFMTKANQLDKKFGIDLRQFETTIMQSEFGVLNRGGSRRGPTVKKLLRNAARERILQENEAKQKDLGEIKHSVIPQLDPQTNQIKLVAEKDSRPNVIKGAISDAVIKEHNLGLYGYEDDHNAIVKPGMGKGSGKGTGNGKGNGKRKGKKDENIFNRDSSADRDVVQRISSVNVKNGNHKLILQQQQGNLSTTAERCMNKLGDALTLDATTTLMKSVDGKRGSGATKAIIAKVFQTGAAGANRGGRDSKARLDELEEEKKKREDNMKRYGVPDPEDFNIIRGMTNWQKTTDMEFARFDEFDPVKTMQEIMSPKQKGNEKKTDGQCLPTTDGKHRLSDEKTLSLEAGKVPNASVTMGKNTGDDSRNRHGEWPPSEMRMRAAHSYVPNTNVYSMRERFDNPERIKVARSAGRKSVTNYYEDKLSYSWTQPKQEYKPDVYEREMTDFREQYLGEGERNDDKEDRKEENAKKNGTKMDNERSVSPGRRPHVAHHVRTPSSRGAGYERYHNWNGPQRLHEDPQWNGRLAGLNLGVVSFKEEETFPSVMVSSQTTSAMASGNERRNQPLSDEKENFYSRKDRKIYRDEQAFFDGKDHMTEMDYLPYSR